MSEDNETISPFHKGQIITDGMVFVRDDLCDWINTLFKDCVITEDTFLSSLHSGVLLCDIIKRIYQLIPPAELPSSWPTEPPRADRGSIPRSYKARDNVCLFLAWCRLVGLRNTILFETKGLMNNDEEKNVVLTLLHLGEMCLYFGIPVPQFAKFKKEIDVEKLYNDQYNSVYILMDYSNVGSMDSGFYSVRSTSNIEWIDKSLMSSSNTLSLSSKTKLHTALQDQTPISFTKSYIQNENVVLSQMYPSQNIMSKSTNDLAVIHSRNKGITDCNQSKVDGKVSDLSKSCCCETKFKIERTTMNEGMYRIGSKDIFVRMFKDNIMLRIGGGWETLYEYLDKVHPGCKMNERQNSATTLKERNMTIDKITSKDLKKFNQTEFTKVKKVNPNNFSE